MRKRHFFTSARWLVCVKETRQGISSDIRVVRSRTRRNHRNHGNLWSAPTAHGRAVEGFRMTSWDCDTTDRNNIGDRRTWKQEWLWQRSITDHPKSKDSSIYAFRSTCAKPIGPSLMSLGKLGAEKTEYGLWKLCWRRLNLKKLMFLNNSEQSSTLI